MLDPAGKGKGSGEVGDDGNDFERRKAPLKLSRALLEIVARNVHRDVNGRRNRFEQDRRLGRRSRPEFHHGRASWNTRCNLRHDLMEDRGLCARRIIGWQAGDFVEQLRPAAVVKPAGGNCRDGGRKAGEHVVSKRLVLVRRCIGIKRLEQVEPP